jgi:P27 family predicted phage terminase small subunit
MSRVNDPIPLKIVKGRGMTRDGQHHTDQEGKPIPNPPAYRRVAPKRPDWLSEDAVPLWDMVVRDNLRLGMIKELDGFALQVGCEAYARWRAAVRHRQELAMDPDNVGGGLITQTSQGWGVAPWVRVEADASRDFRQWCAEFGLTPSAEVHLARLETNPGGAGSSAYA